MKISLKKVFGASAGKAMAGAGLAAAMVITSGCTTTGSSTGSSKGSQCIGAAQNDNFNSRAQNKLRDIRADARSTPSGQYIMADSESRNTRICFEDDLMNGKPAGTIFLGRYYNSKNLIELNPGVSATSSTGTLVHEGRHRQQALRDLSWSKRGNIPGQERMILNWLNEADARVSSIVFAYEMKQRGQNQYWNNLRGDNWYSHMVRAFDRSMSANGDIKAAMRAALMEFRENRMLTRAYDGYAVGWIEDNRRHFDPSRPARTILSDENLQALGNTAYGNYMTPELMNWIRQSVSAQDYAQARDRYLRSPGFRAQDIVPLHEIGGHIHKPK